MAKPAQLRSSLSTYEATKAARLAGPDPIHWDSNNAFRDSEYRQLKHQNGIIGLCSCRLLEAADLQRPYWSALALGPVKHLGLSKAHGAVSSFCSFSLLFQDHEVEKLPTIPSGDQKKPAAQEKKPCVVSPVIPEDNHPVWDNCQFEFPLKKGIADGQRILLAVRVEEEGTAVENFLPANRVLGMGKLDLTELCLGETASGQPLPGIMDAWIPIQMEGQSTGRVRVLVSYNPIGLEPQPKDLVAFEAFARRNIKNSSCRPVIDPYTPFLVLDRRGSYILAEYSLPDGRKTTVRLHRNSLFVIERQNMVDSLYNLALLPVDVAMRTPVGQGISNALQPLTRAVMELSMPALLSFKLVWMAVRTTGLGVVSGVQALGGTILHEGTTSLTGSQRRRRNDREVNTRGAQFVQL